MLRHPDFPPLDPLAIQNTDFKYIISTFWKMYLKIMKFIVKSSKNSHRITQVFNHWIPPHPDKTFKNWRFSQHSFATWPFRIPNNFQHFSIDFSVNVTNSDDDENLQTNARLECRVALLFFHKRADLRTWLFSQISFLRKARTVTNSSLSINESRFPMNFSETSTVF